jgi:transcriptional regulator with XRE-family HTH domain
VGVYLRERRDALGLTQAALAKQLDVSNPKISSWETGKDPLPPERYADIARILDFDVYTFSKVILRYSNPHLFDIMFPGEDPTIKDELSQLESRVFIPYGGEPSNQ